MGVNGDKCSFSTKPGAKRSQSWDQLTGHLSTALNECAGFKEGSAKYRGQHMSGNTYSEREKQDHKKTFIIWQMGLLVEKKRGRLGAVVRLIIIMEQQQAPLTVGNIMLKRGYFSFSGGEDQRNMLCVSACVCACVVSCLLLDLKRDWLSAVQSCHLGTPSPQPASTPTLINCCCYANFICAKKTPKKEEKMVAVGVTWERESAFQTQTSRIEMSLLFCVNGYFNPEWHRHTCRG